MTPEAMLDRLGDRLKLLAGGARDVPERQRTIRDTLEWSYELLTDEERDLFFPPGVFCSRVPLRGAEGVLGAGPRLARLLVGKDPGRARGGRHFEPQDNPD